MKNWLSWTNAGLIAVTTVGYASFRDPLVDLWVAAKTIESHWPVAANQNTEDRDTYDDDLQYSEDNASKTRFVQKFGGRFGKDSQDNGNKSHQRDHYLILRAFKEAVGDKWKSTVQVLEKNRQVALGTIVASDGWIVSKDSEVLDKEIEIRLHDGSKAEGVVKLRRHDLDLALIKIQRENLSPIVWDSKAEVPVGGWLASTDIRNTPVSIGVLGVLSRDVRRETPVLGVRLVEPPEGEKGALVSGVIVGSGADRAGVRVGDVIDVINSDTLKSLDDAFKRLHNLKAGQIIEIRLLREGKHVLTNAQMMDLPNPLHDPTEMEVNGDISARSTGFKSVIQHDSVLAPNQCGGPIVDVNGNAVGLNIARAGRVSSYAIPARTLSLAINDMLVSVQAVRHSENNVVQVSGQTPIELPASVPAGITIESAKPEVVLPESLKRR